jgi:SPP1 gp7 family putative phage head morphogenesis protein
MRTGIKARRASRASRVREHLLQARMRAALERPLAAALARAFNALADDAARRPFALEQVIAAHRKLLANLLAPAYARTIQEFGGKLIAALSKIEPGKSAGQHAEECKARVDEQYAALVRRFTEKWTAKRAKTISETSHEKLTRLIDRGTREGLHEDELGAEIRERIGGDIGASRARTIARTETHAASQDAQFEVAQESGIDFMKEWVAVEDDRTRDDHVEANGQEVAMHEHFTVGDSELLYPGDPTGTPEQVINCRCVCVFNPI